MKMGKKTSKVLTGMVLAITVMSAVSGITASAAGTEKTDTKTAAELGFTFTDRPVLDDSWAVAKSFSVDFENAGVVHYCVMTCGFEDGVTSNSDYVQIPASSGVSSEMQVYGTVVNSNGLSGATNTVKNGTKSSKASVKHTGDNVTYKVTFIHP